MAPAVRAVTAEELDARLAEFAEVLRACVLDGASVGFVVPFPAPDAEAFWREAVRPPLAAGRRLLFAIEAGGRVAGTVQLIHDTPPNQPHRAEVAKLLVHPAQRRRGLARALDGGGRGRGASPRAVAADPRHPQRRSGRDALRRSRVPRWRASSPAGAATRCPSGWTRRRSCTSRWHERDRAAARDSAPVGVDEAGDRAGVERRGWCRSRGPGRARRASHGRRARAARRRTRGRDGPAGGRRRGRGSARRSGRAARGTNSSRASSTPASASSASSSSRGWKPNQASTITVASGGDRRRSARRSRGSSRARARG